MIQYLQPFKRLAFLTTFSGVYMYVSKHQTNKSPKNISWCTEIQQLQFKNTSEAIEDTIVNDDEEWEKEKEKCGFCKYFLLSPCKEVR